MPIILLDIVRKIVRKFARTKTIIRRISFALLLHNTVEGEGLYCLLCRNMTHSPPKTNPKLLTRNPASDFALKLCQTISKLYSRKTLYLQRCNIGVLLQKTLDECERVAEDVLVKVFTAAYWLMKEELPNHKIKSLLQLREQVRMNDLKHFLHRSQDVLREIFLTLGKTVQDTFLSKLKQAAHFGLLVDDVTDICY